MAKIKAKIKAASKTRSNKKSAPANLVSVGFIWDVRPRFRKACDIDLSAFGLEESGKVGSEKDFVFYNRTRGIYRAVYLTPDHLHGRPGALGLDEEMKIDLDRVPARIKSIALVVSIHKAKARRQNLTRFHNITMHVQTSQIHVQSNIEDPQGKLTAVVFAKLIRQKDKRWQIVQVAEGIKGGLPGACASYGIDAK